MLRATNTGMTAMVNPDGSVAAALPPFTTAALVVNAQGRTGRTPYTRWGNALALLQAKIGETVSAADGLSMCAPLAKSVGDSVVLLNELTAHLLRSFATAGGEAVLANASVYLDLCGRILISWMWLRQAIVAERALVSATADDSDFYRGKLQAARYYITWELPEIYPQAEILRRIDPTCFAMQDAWF